MSILEGDNGPVFGANGPPKLIYTGPGVFTSHELLLSNWTEEGFLLVKDDTDKSLYEHPFNTVFNVEHPVSLRSRHKDDIRPDILGYQAFTLSDISSAYLKNLISLAESTIGRDIENIAIVLPDGQNVRTIAKEVFSHKIKGSYFDRVSTDDDDPNSDGSRMDDVSISLLPDGRKRYARIYKRSEVSIFPFNHGMHYRRGFLVYHLSNSTYEVSVHKVDGDSSEMLSSVHRRNLGGNNFSHRVIDHLLRTYNNKHGQDPAQNEIFLRRIVNEVEKAKSMLNTHDWAQINVQHPDSGGQDLSEKLTRHQFEDLNMDLFNKTFTLIDQAIKDSLEFKKDDIQEIVFSGRSANIPFLQSYIKQYFGVEKIYHGLIEPEYTVVQAAAKFHHWYQDRRHFGGEMCCFTDTPELLGIETAGGAMFLFTKQSSDPMDLREMYTFSTTKDNQDRVLIRVYKGQRRWTNQNIFLGEIELTGIAQAPKGIPQIRVRISTSSCNEYVNLSVMDTASGRINGTIFPAWTSISQQEKGLALEKGIDEVEPAGKMMSRIGNRQFNG
ncbi:hypothetical protein BGZ80_002048 [Entomortierella chlamydospora]|uniref:Hsp70 family chaperone n=1 Tax=Entomortierella chlamydospora TaxID=101097 RepID=A0A9P6MQB4_9FUNG|nr:hypothetical protein BGZ79_009409 [Entomortierella chlamydospora]KAG0009792.1 hypothetical protein BGZ80_002048 [Entomortierella chlamydospora]